MPIIATTTTTPRELTPTGNYVARCYKMIELGTLRETINGDTKELKKILIGWEFPNDTKVFDPAKGAQPIVVSEEYTLSTGEKSNLRKMLESWRGKGFSADEAKAFDVTAVLGKPCMINIIHTPKKTDPTKFYDKISSVTGIPKGMIAPAQVNPTFLLSYDDWSWEKFDSLPEWIKDKMKKSFEYAALTTPNSQQMAAHQDGLPAPQRNASGDVVSAIDDLPF